jgi:hypothetical protein
MKVYSNLLFQANDPLQQFTVSSKLPFTAIYCVNQITVYSNLLCQVNYRLQQFTVSRKLPFTEIYCVQQYFNYVVAVSFIGGENLRPASHRHKLYHIKLSSTPRHERDSNSQL